MPSMLYESAAYCRKADSRHNGYCYIGYYINTDNEYVIKIGQSARPHKRRLEHDLDNVKRIKIYPQMPETSFIYLHIFPVVNMDTAEGKLRDYFKTNYPQWTFRKNDRFITHMPVGQHLHFKYRTTRTYEFNL